VEEAEKAPSMLAISCAELDGGDVGGDPPGLVAAESLAADPIGLSCRLLLLLFPKATYLGVR
jgi:hypothetical protein